MRFQIQLRSFLPQGLVLRRLGLLVGMLFFLNVAQAAPALDEFKNNTSPAATQAIAEVSGGSASQGNQPDVALESVTFASLMFGGFALLATRQRRRVLKLNKVPR